MIVKATNLLSTGQFRSSSVQGTDTSKEQNDDLSVRFFSSLSSNLTASLSPGPAVSSGMTIIAATSPEIKALNLPTTPSFPAELDYGFSTDSSKKNRRNNCRLSHGFLDEDARKIPDNSKAERPQSIPETTVFYEDDDRDDLAAQTNIFFSPPPRATMAREMIVNSSDYNKENIHPNLMNVVEEDTAKTLCLDIEDHEGTFQMTKPKMLVRRKSLHRRDSISSLPSPDAISARSHDEAMVLDATPRRCNSSRGNPSFPFFSYEETCPALNTGAQMAQKRMQLRTGFR